MELDSYTCYLCLRRKVETGTLILEMQFCQSLLELNWDLCHHHKTNFPNLQTDQGKAMCAFFPIEVIILMTWSVWTTSNDWMFNNIDPQVQNCKRRFLSEFSLLLHRVRPDKISAMEVWMNPVQFVWFF
jgi:hypothetical protein